MTETFDYILIGAGSAGSLLTARLSEEATTNVCVLEAGPRDSNLFIHIPAGFIKTMVNPKINWLYQTEPSAGTAGRRIQQPRGKTLGGSGSINGHVYNRGQQMDYNVWAQFGNRGWGYADILPYFKRSERRLGAGDDHYRGREGEFVVEDLRWQHPLLDAFIAGAVGMGIPENHDYNGPRQEGVARAQRSIYRGRRMSPARAFLRPAMKRNNVDVRTKALVDHILFEGKRAVGVRYISDGITREVRARKEVILCGGAFNSPQLLQRSGVGSAELLNDLGVPIVHVLPGVGENLRDHYAMRVSAQVRGINTINERARGLRLAGEVFKYCTGQRSILELQPTLIYCFWKSDDVLERSDIQLTFTPASYQEGVQAQLEKTPGMTCAVWQQRPESTGYVRARSRNPHDAPLIQPNYLAHEIDQRVILAGVRLTRRLLQTPQLAPYNAGETYPGDHVNSDNDDEMLAAIRQRCTTCFHPMGTCRMGPATDPSAVVDDQLRVHGIEALRVVDASVMPTMPSANTHAATLMIAEKAADMIRGLSPLPAAESA